MLTYQRTLFLFARGQYSWAGYSNIIIQGCSMVQQSIWPRNYTSNKKFYFNEFVANVLQDVIGIVIFDLRGHGGCQRPKTPLGGQNYHEGVDLLKKVFNESFSALSKTPWRIQSDLVYNLHVERYMSDLRGHCITLYLCSYCCCCWIKHTHLQI